jgi:hypothetical protein
MTLLFLSAVPDLQGQSGTDFFVRDRIRLDKRKGTYEKSAADSDGEECSPSRILFYFGSVSRMNSAR